MDKESGGAKLSRLFGFSWADEVEREEQLEQQQEEAAAKEPLPRGGDAGDRRAKPDPFRAARHREVVLAEKGVDWRARDRELDDAYRRRGAAHGGRVHGDKRHAAVAAPAPAPPVTYSGAWGDKRKCAGEAPAPARHAQPVAGQARRVLGQLNIGDAGGSSCNNNSIVSAGAKAIKPRNAAAADGEIGDGGVPVPAPAPALGEGGAGKKRRKSRRGKGRKMRSNKTSLLL